MAMQGEHPFGLLDQLHVTASIDCSSQERRLHARLSAGADTEAEDFLDARSRPGSAASARSGYSSVAAGV